MTDSLLPPGKKIAPPGISAEMTAAQLIDQTFQGFNAARLREACELFAQRYCQPNAQIGVSLAGALVPTGLGRSCLVPMIKNGWIDWMVSTGANLYHDLHFALGQSLYRGSPFVNDCELHHQQIIRIYDVVMHFNNLEETDAYIRRFCIERAPSEPIGTAQLHYELGCRLLEECPGCEDYSVLAAAARYKVPIYVSSPGDSGIGMNIAACASQGHSLVINPSIDVNETAALVYWAQSQNRSSAVLLLGGGSPKNFVLQTEPQLQEVYNLDVKGHDYFIQFTDARADTGGLSGATPSEAVSWGKIKEEQLNDCVVCYADASLCLPLLTAYACGKAQPKPHANLFDVRQQAVEKMTANVTKKF